MRFLIIFNSTNLFVISAFIVTEIYVHSFVELKIIINQNWF